MSGAGEYGLFDKSGRRLGSVRVAGVRSNTLTGTFTEAPLFASVSNVFRRFEELVESNALAVLPDAEREIAALGLVLRADTDLPISDVQIYSDGGFSCRVSVDPLRNGSAAVKSESAIPV
jgi:hypothetical protein